MGAEPRRAKRLCNACTLPNMHAPKTSASVGGSGPQLWWLHGSACAVGSGRPPGCSVRRSLALQGSAAGLPRPLWRRHMPAAWASERKGGLPVLTKVCPTNLWLAATTESNERQLLNARCSELPPPFEQAILQHQRMQPTQRQTSHTSGGRNASALHTAAQSLRLPLWSLRIRTVPLADSATHTHTHTRCAFMAQGLIVILSESFQSCRVISMGCPMSPTCDHTDIASVPDRRDVRAAPPGALGRIPAPGWRSACVARSRRNRNPSGARARSASGCSSLRPDSSWLPRRHADATSRTAMQPRPCCPQPNKQGARSSMWCHISSEGVRHRPSPSPLGGLHAIAQRLAQLTATRELLLEATVPRLARQAIHTLPGCGRGVATEGALPWALGPKPLTPLLPPTLACNILHPASAPTQPHAKCVCRERQATATMASAPLVGRTHADLRAPPTAGDVRPARSPVCHRVRRDWTSDA